jgi:hypothetical protein
MNILSLFIAVKTSCLTRYKTPLYKELTYNAVQKYTTLENQLILYEHQKPCSKMLMSIYPLLSPFFVPGV